MNKKIKLGREVFLLRNELYRSRNEGLIKTQITKIGRKYFYVDGEKRSKFDINTLTEVNDANYKGKIYLTEKEYNEILEFDFLSKNIKSFFSGYGKLKLSLSKLREINQIIGND